LLEAFFIGVVKEILKYFVGKVLIASFFAQKVQFIQFTFRIQIEANFNKPEKLKPFTFESFAIPNILIENSDRCTVVLPGKRKLEIVFNN